MNTLAFYDTKPYDREYFERAPDASRLRLQFHEFRLTSETAASVDGAQAVCVFVNDRLDAPCLNPVEEAEGIFFEDHSGEILQDDGEPARSRNGRSFPPRDYAMKRL